MTTPAFASSPLYTLDSINALLTRLPAGSRRKEEDVTQIQLLSAKLSILQSSTPLSGFTNTRSVQPASRNASTNRNTDDKEQREGADAQQQQQQLDLTETRVELVDCYLRQGNLILGESEAVQVVAACKKVVKLFPPSKPTTGTSPAVPETDTTPNTISRPPSNSVTSSAAEPAVYSSVHHSLRWSRAYDRALSALLEIDTQRGITGRVERWRGMRDRLRSTQAVDRGMGE
ncbi:hypothetical protein QFC21_002297 [Naganishia friedmannii]|uniref:Uncharacterized protein n=1 Tax=Naganishia friedmannii TaxID=89922 RepID=A0ACC2VXK0_9TREE|nr:hypothetical protein QFC21_002297 [Naganishia friedmannii]